MKIRVIAPVITKQFEATALEELSPAARPDTELSLVSLDKGPASIESRYESALAVPDVVAKIVQAEQDGMDAVIVDCMDDPGVEAGRELVSIPVVGPAETTTTSEAVPASFIRTAASTAISQKGFMAILTLVSSTPD